MADVSEAFELVGYGGESIRLVADGCACVDDPGRPASKCSACHGERVYIAERSWIAAGRPRTLEELRAARAVKGVRRIE